MKTKTQLRIIILILVTLGLGAAIYKNQVLGFSFFPQEKVDTWTIEAKITFTGEGGPSTVTLHKPDSTINISTISQETVSDSFANAKNAISGDEDSVVWKNDKAEGEQIIYYRVQAYKKKGTSKLKAIPAEAPDASKIVFEGAAGKAVDQIIKDIKKAGGDNPVLITQALLKNLAASKKDHLKMLLESNDSNTGFLGLVNNILAKAGVHSFRAKGLFLDKKSRTQKLTTLLEVFDGKEWQIINPKTGKVCTQDDLLIWHTGDGSIFEVTGGKDSKLVFSINTGRMMAGRAAILAGKNTGAALIDFSIYSLPIAEQNTFKLLLLIPLGALVVVILRNLVGIQTSGTFMPILIALAFLQTSLVWGLILFLVVVSVGLLMRSYLSHLNLLLVPRISAVLVFVIIIFIAISVISIKMDFQQGLRVTFFPMIIISWTIERMSVLWEEEGPRDVFVQGGGSLFTASIIYLLMTNRFLEHLVFSFPELLLVLLAVILIIGSYSGYRLSELRRFEPMIREK